MRRTVVALSFLALALTACASTGGQDSEGPLKIGYIGPLTGDASTYGSDTLNGVKMKVEEINTAGGLNGRQIELIAEDSRCTGTDAASAVQKLINVDKVVAIVGGQCSGETLGAAPIAEAKGIVMISPLSSSPDVTDAGTYIFRNYPSDALKTKAAAKYFAEQGWMKVAIITENTDFAVAFRDALKENVAANGGALVFDEVVEPNTKDFRTLVTRLKDAKFDVFFPNGQTSGTIGPMIQQFREQGLGQPMVTHDAGADKSVIEVAGGAAEGMQAINVPELSDDLPFATSFREKYGDAQSFIGAAAHAYDAAGVLFQAIEKSGTDGTAIRDELNKLHAYNGVVGQFSFDTNGDVVGIPYWLYEVKDGVLVKVRDIALD